MNKHRAGPSFTTLGVISALVVGLHMALLLGAPQALQVSLRAPSTPPPVFQTRVLTLPAASEASVTPAPSKRVARPLAAPSPNDQLPLPSSDPAQPELPSASAIVTAPEAPTNTAAAPPMASTVAPADMPASANEPLPAQAPAPMLLAVGALPPSTLLSYKLTGQEKGLTYYASGELRWQHNPTNYEASLTIKAFLIGSRVFASVGTVGAQGLMPLRHSDKWRGEKATHFDTENQRIHFSNNKPSTDLLPGAQDQVSLYVQLAAAMAGDPDRYKPGSSVSIQTATINDAVPWTLTLQSEESVQIDFKPVLTTKWVCLPRGKYDTQVELWLSRSHAWMPVRIRITQVSGSFIDMVMDGIQPLAPLVSVAAAK